MSGNDRRGIVIQERDRHLLRELALMRVIDREQAKIVAGFHSTTRANARLLALSRAGLLRRFFLGTGGAGHKALYGLSQKGAFFVGVPLRGPQRRANERLVADYFIEHQLTVNDIYCALKYGSAFPPGVAFHQWRAFYASLAPGYRLIPDGYVELRTSSGTLASFLEVDLGHERRAIWREKVKSYLQFALSGECTRQFGQDRFRVLVLVSTERKLQSIRKVVAAVTDKIFWFAPLESIHRDGFFAPIWLRPKTEGPQTFIRETS
jgi:hypothetical protein